jgi:hypothetical protein
MPRWKTIVLLMMVASLLVAARVAAQGKKKQDVFKPLRYFVGSWEGSGEGRPGESKVEREYQFVLGDRFLEAKNKSVYEPQQDNPEGEVHEDWGLFSYDQNRGKLMFRQFHEEGFVNRYALDSLSADGKTLVFVTEAIENFDPGWKTREIYHILNDNEFTETFEIAPPDMDFELYITNHFKRKH